MDRRPRAPQWRRARHHHHDLCPPIGRRAATALLWLSCSIALLRALATSNGRAQQRRSFLNAHHRSAAQVFPEPPESDPELEEAEPEPTLPECLEYEEAFDYESETESEIESETDFDTEPGTAPTTEAETEPEDERGPAVPKHSAAGQSLSQRLRALGLRSPDASPRRAQPSAREPQRPREGEVPRNEDPRDPEKPKEKQQRRRCKPKQPARRAPSPEPPAKRGPIPIRRH
ncbi:neuroendocrine secretory protein 55-like [Pteropus vampyrus]|uniref:Neuroendocrine secretory protein 55-like n=1 Tax=Pteropus vampyrus TaxID=132908 RepID=A0A6P6CSM3_PTEVA|nr:neuroendocrine secretory protein 55-like [Pteropus vampyrus]